MSACHAAALAAILLPVAAAQSPVPARPPAAHATVPNARGAMDAALAWLVAHQDEDGSWSASQFMRHDPKNDLCKGVGKPDQDFHVTAWATTALLASGNTTQQGPHRECVAKALNWLEARIGKDGFIGEPSAANATAAHAIATFSLSEGRALSESTAPAAPFRRLAELRLANGTWPARPGETAGDAATTWWACWALLSGNEFGVQAFDLAPTIAFADGHARFLDPAAEALLRIFAHHDRAHDAVLDRLCTGLGAQLPAWPSAKGAPAVDFLTWQLASCVMMQQGGDEWRDWEQALEAALLPHQRTDGAHAGSWDLIDQRGRECGRVYATAVNALALSYRKRFAVVVQPPPRRAPK
jgi:hypothetical protein